jgi:hypothetical protein
VRLGLYVIVFALCAAVAAREAYYFLAGTTTTGTVVAFGKTGQPGGRSSGYWADYEYFDAQGDRHVHRARSFTFSLDAAIPTTTQVGDSVEVQYLRYSPETGRLWTSPLGGICFGFVAMLSVAAFAAELWMCTRRRPKHAH